MQKQPWVRLYRNSLHNPKLVTLGERAHLTWYRLLSIADDDGNLPQIRYIASDLRMSVQDAEILLADLVDAGLVDANYGNGPISFHMHDWNEHQHRSDSSAERTRKYRSKIKGNSENSGNKTSLQRHGDGDVTPPDTDTDTDTENTKPARIELDAASGPSEIDGLNGSTKMIVDQMAIWLNPYAPDHKQAHKTVADAVQLYGSQSVRDGFADLKAKHADGDIRAMTVTAFYGFVKRSKEGRQSSKPQTATEKYRDGQRKAMALIDKKFGGVQ